MSDHWYEVVGPKEPLMQGDLITDCPVLAWKEERTRAGSAEASTERLRSGFDAIAVDVVIMTQACDLAQHKVRNVTLCRHDALAEWRTSWEEDRRAKSRGTGNEAWQNLCNNIRNGFVWNLSMLNAADLDDIKLEHRVVDFHEVYTVPRVFLESFLREQNSNRPRLLPPYREHLSQAFARFYMRVGLPVDVTVAW
jgi:hypothetical protein